ncbi:MAG: hypothetical protein ACR2Q3_03445 [Woeseiaceae bacterium]
MRKFNVIWGSALLVFAVAASIFVAATDQPPVYYVLSMVPFVIGANSLQIGFRELNAQPARKTKRRR